MSDLTMRPKYYVRHKKRGTTYAVLGQAILQTDHPLFDNAPLIIYHNADEERIWARAEAEFGPPRFERIDPPNSEAITELGPARARINYVLKYYASDDQPSEAQPVRVRPADLRAVLDAIDTLTARVAALSTPKP